MQLVMRRAGEIVRINDDIQVRVLGMYGAHVRFSIEAATDVSIEKANKCKPHHDEIYQANGVGN
ncbi:MAG: carbon storage regulator [Gammaproteobacteria bacterium]|nr:carbon storage regulator [Gammaproteobacteria bacterium]